jgi:hypothetical protein
LDRFGFLLKRKVKAALDHLAPGDLGAAVAGAIQALGPEEYVETLNIVPKGRSHNGWLAPISTTAMHLPCSPRSYF